MESALYKKHSEQRSPVIIGEMIPCFFYGASQPPEFPGEKVGEALLYGFKLREDAGRLSLLEDAGGVVRGSVHMMPESGWNHLGGERVDVVLDFWGEILKADTLSSFHF